MKETTKTVEKLMEDLKKLEMQYAAMERKTMTPGLIEALEQLNKATNDIVDRINELIDKNK